jgi:hypothetical protein
MPSAIKATDDINPNAATKSGNSILRRSLHALGVPAGDAGQRRVADFPERARDLVQPMQHPIRLLLTLLS